MGEKRSQIRIKGNTSDEKFKHLETILKRMARHMNQKVVGVIPPSPIFHYVDKPDDKGVILRGIFPKGELTKICLAIRKYNTKKLVKFICSLETSTGNGKQYTFETHKSLMVEKVNLSVDDISFFTLRVEVPEEYPELDPPLVEDIWATALFQFEQSDSQLKIFMLEELIKLEDLDEGI